MIDILSKAKRILMQKPEHVIDASVLFGIFDNKNESNKKACERYLGAINHKYRGFTTIPLLGETFLAITKSSNPLFRNTAYEYLTELIKRKALTIIPIRKGGDAFIEEISKRYRISDDDAAHLSNAVHSGHSIFITLDGDIIGQKIEVNNGNERCILDVYHPAEMINRLKI